MHNTARIDIASHLQKALAELEAAKRRIEIRTTGLDVRYETHSDKITCTWIESAIDSDISAIRELWRDE